MGLSAPRRMRRKSCRLRVVFVACLALTALAVVPATASPVAPAHAAKPAATLQADGESSMVQTDAANWYANYFNVSLDTAYQRLQIQDDAQAVVAQVESAIGSQWAGSWFDANDQGRFKIGVATTQNTPSGSNIDKAKAILATTGVDQYTDFVSEPSSMTQLKTAEASLESRLPNLVRAHKIQPGISPSTNAVTVDVANNLTPSEAAQVKANLPRQVHAETARRDLRGTTFACTIQQGIASYNELYCDPPLRGGPVIGANSGTTLETCTAGFVVQSNSNGIAYLMTAGHCISEAPTNKWTTRFSDDTVHTIGDSHSHTFDKSGDYGIIEINNSSGWGLTGGTYVWVGQSSGDATTPDSTYNITSTGTSSQYMAICATSGVGMQTGYNTDCGEVTKLNTSDGHTDGLGETNICGRTGASGGPLYKNHMGYGLIVYGDTTTCDTQYQGLAEAEAGSNVGLL